MMKFAILLAFAACVGIVSSRGILGGISSVVVNDDVRQKLDEVIEQANSEEKVKEITGVAVQIVSGIRYYVKYTSVNEKKCNVSWQWQPWKKPAIHSIELKCNESEAAEPEAAEPEAAEPEAAEA